MINTKGISAETVAITDFQIVASKVAKVVIAYTGRQNKEQITQALASKLKFLAAPVENSFRVIKAGVAVGFIRANREIRAVEDVKELRAAYKVMSSNILMDNADRTLWELKEGAGGKFLARHGNEDLSELVHAQVNSRSDVPAIRQLSMATASAKEFVAYAGPTGDMDYGFCIASSEQRGKLKIVSASTGTAVTIPTEAVVSVCNIGIPKAAHAKVVAAGINRNDKAQQIEYYSRLYSYSPDYLSEVIRQIEESAVM